MLEEPAIHRFDHGVRIEPGGLHPPLTGTVEAVEFARYGTIADEQGRAYSNGWIEMSEDEVSERRVVERLAQAG